MFAPGVLTRSSISLNFLSVSPGVCGYESPVNRIRINLMVFKDCNVYK